MTHGDLSTVVERGDLRESLVAIRGCLSALIDSPERAKHRRECNCVCGIGDDRALVPIFKELRAVIEAIEALPEGREVTKLDRLAAGVADELAPRRSARVAGTAGS